MKKYILIIICLVLLNCKMAIADHSTVLEKIEQRTIVPYPILPARPNALPSIQPIQTMPFYHGENRERITPHLIPYIRFSPNPNGPGLGTEFGLNFGIFRSHGLDFGINLF